MGRLHIPVGKAARPGRFQSGRQNSTKGKGRDPRPGLRQENLACVKRAYRLFFFFAAFLVFFLLAFFFGFAFFAAFFRAGFFFPAFLARFFAAGFDAGFGAAATPSGSSPTITSSSSSSTISSVSPPSSSSSSRDSSLSSSKLSLSISIPSSRGGIFGSGQKTGPEVTVLARALLNTAPALAPLLSHSSEVVKHSAVFLQEAFKSSPICRGRGLVAEPRGSVEAHLNHS